MLEFWIKKKSYCIREKIQIVPVVPSVHLNNPEITSVINTVTPSLYNLINAYCVFQNLEADQRSTFHDDKKHQTKLNSLQFKYDQQRFFYISSKASSKESFQYVCNSSFIRSQT